MKVRGSKPIDAIAVPCGMLERTDERISLERDEAILIDHVTCLIGLNLEDFLRPNE